MDINTQMILAATVHDVKNSLGMINAQLNDIAHKLSGPDPSASVEIRRLQLETTRINNGLVHMLGLYKMQKNRFVPNFEEVMVEDVVSDVCSRYNELVESMSISLSIDSQLPDPIWYMDAMLIEGVLANVMTNTIRYTKSQIHISVTEQDGWLLISISDDGVGYPSSLIDFVSTPGNIDFNTGSTGLGLYFCQQIALLHKNQERQGYIELSNAEQGGAVFKLYLP